jgi:hypothetical protein
VLNAWVRPTYTRPNSFIPVNHPGQPKPRKEGKEQLGRDSKGTLSMALSMLGIARAFIEPLVAFGAYALVASRWFIPDRRLATSGDAED